jgi:hypothetical protein
MKAAAYLSGGSAVMKSYQVSATVSNTGIPLTASTGDEAGIVVPASGTDASDMVGLNYDTVTYVTAQQTDGTSPERKVRMDIRPDIIINSRMSGGATSGTAIPLLTETVADTNGTVITCGDAATPETDGGSLFCYSGANAGQIRKVTTSSSTAYTVLVAFDNDTIVGDDFFRIPFWVMDSAADTVDMTSDFTEIDLSTAIGSDNALLTCIEIGALDISREGTLKSYCLLVPTEHFLNPIA